MKTFIIIIIAVFYLLLRLLIGSEEHVGLIKQNADKTWAEAGFEIIGYEGYQRSSWPISGGSVWYIVKRKESPTIYHGFISKRGDEFHIYNLKAINAISGQ